MTLPLSSGGIVSPVPSQADMQECSPITRGIISSSGGVQRLMTPHGVWGSVRVGEGAGLGAWMSGAWGDLEYLVQVLLAPAYAAGQV